MGIKGNVVIYAMTTSSAADAPRGMEFLYSPNRLNAATSRARRVAVVVASRSSYILGVRDLKLVGETTLDGVLG